MSSSNAAENTSHTNQVEEDIETWELPHVHDPRTQDENTPTNAFNLRPGWKYEPPEEEEEILPPTAEEIEAIRAAAYEEGFNEGKQSGFEKGFEEGTAKGHEQGLTSGHEEGRTAGFEEGSAHAQDVVSTFERAVEQLTHPLSLVNESVKKQVTKLAVALAKSVVQTEITTNLSVIETALNKALEALPINETSVQIHLHPDDLGRLSTLLSPERCDEKGWTIIEKSSMTPGGCEVVSENNAVDVSVERRTRDVIDAFLMANGLDNESA